MRDKAHRPGKDYATTRREVLLAAATIGVASAAPLGPAVADAQGSGDKRRSRYQAGSAEVQTYYRVNRYPPK